MKKITKIIVSLLMIAAMMAPMAFSVAAADYYMAYNFYSNPVLSGTSGKFDSFMIDFRGTKTPNNTYWALCNFAMDLSSNKTRAAYPSISGYGAYCGLQNRSVSQGKAGILSFWEAGYQAPGSIWDAEKNGYYLDGEKVVLTASRMYPDGNSTFTGEGDGTNCIAPYLWNDDVWYTMLLHSWTDAETGTTFVGEWFRDNETGEWTLFAYFDTHLFDSYFIGGMSQFQENYSRYSYNYVYDRECNLKNMYAYDHSQNKWQSLNRSTLSYGDGGGNNKAGAHSFGVSGDENDSFFWGSTGGVVEDQAAYEAAAIKQKSYTITQPTMPAFSGADGFTASLNGTVGDRTVSWSIPGTSDPQLGYTVKVYDYEGNLLAVKTSTRPEENYADLSDITEEYIICEIAVDSVFAKNAYTATVTSSTQLIIDLSADEINYRDEELSVAVDMIDPKAAVYGFSFELHYDADKLLFDRSAFSEQFPYARAVSNVPGVVRVFGATSNNIPVEDDAHVVDLTFKVIDPEKTMQSTYYFTPVFYNGQPAYTMDVDRNVVTLSDVEMHALSVSIRDVAYDMNGDGKVNISDITVLLDYLSGNVNGVASGKACDLNGDTVFNISDVTVLLDYLSSKV